MIARADRIAAVRSRSNAWFKHLNPSLVAGLVLIAIVLVVTVVVPAVSPYGANQITVTDPLASPGPHHWLGGDDLGRDVLTRVAVGYRISLSVAFGSVLLGLLFGIPLGTMAGYFGGFTDNVLMRPLDALMAFPPILLAITIIAIAGSGVLVITLALGIVYVPIIARVMRSGAVGTRQELYVTAARARGASHIRIALRHVLPNSLGPVIVQASILLGWAVLLEAGLSFIGLGVRPPTPALGSMLATERDYMQQAPWVVIAPGVAIGTLVLGFNLVGDGLRDWLDPRGRARIR
jgi:peptide/nickel transport system permease protein